MNYKGLRKYLPKKFKIGISGRFSPVYASAEWSSKANKLVTRRRSLTPRHRRRRL